MKIKIYGRAISNCR